MASYDILPEISIYSSKNSSRAHKEPYTQEIVRLAGLVSSLQPDDLPIKQHLLTYLLTWVDGRQIIDRDQHYYRYSMLPKCCRVDKAKINPGLKGTLRRILTYTFFSLY